MCRAVSDVLGRAAVEPAVRVQRAEARDRPLDAAMSWRRTRPRNKLARVAATGRVARISGNGHSHWSFVSRPWLASSPAKANETDDQEKHFLGGRPRPRCSSTHVTAPASIPRSTWPIGAASCRLTPTAATAKLYDADRQANPILDVACWAHYLEHSFIWNVLSCTSWRGRISLRQTPDKIGGSAGESPHVRERRCRIVAHHIERRSAYRQPGVADCGPFALPPSP